MWDVVSDRVRVAERIAYTENTIGKLQQQVAPEGGGSDSTQTEELLVVAKGALIHLQNISQSGGHAGGYLAYGWARSETQLLGKCHALSG